MKQCVAEFINKVPKLEKEENNKVIVLLWQWWNERNKFREEGKVRSNDVIYYTIIKQTNEYCHAFLKEKELKKICQEQWKPPRQGALEMNIDGAFHVQTNSGGYGAVIHGHKGSIQACQRWRI